MSQTPMNSTLIQSALLAYAECQTDVGARRAAARKRLDGAARFVAVCTAERVLDITIEPERVIVGIVDDPAFALPSDEGMRIQLVEFAVEVEFGRIVFSLKPGQNNYMGWRPDNARLFIRGPLNTDYEFFRVRNLADLGEYAQTVLMPKGDQSC